MTIGTIAIALALAMPAGFAAQKTPAKEAAGKAQRIERAKERCSQNHGVDCETPEGLKEWLLLERSREEAVREGSRHLPPKKPKPAPAQR